MQQAAISWVCPLLRGIMRVALIGMLVLVALSIVSCPGSLVCIHVLSQSCPQLYTLPVAGCSWVLFDNTKNRVKIKKAQGITALRF